jgi:hypothetical protein
VKIHDCGDATLTHCATIGNRWTIPTAALSKYLYGGWQLPMIRRLRAFARVQLAAPSSTQPTRALRRHVRAALALVCVAAIACRPDLSAIASTFPGTSRPERLKTAAKLILSHQERLHSLHVVVRTSRTKPVADVVRLEVAARGRCRWEQMWHGSWGEDPDDPRPFIRFYDGIHFNLFDPYNRIYETTTRFTTPAHLDKIKNTFFYETLGWWPPEDDATPSKLNGESMYYRDILRDRRLTIVDIDHVCDGHRCDIVEIPFVVRLWIDPAVGVVRRREQLVRSSTGASTPRAIYSYCDFRQYAPDISLPGRITRHILPPKQELAVYDVSYLNVNSVPAAIFAFTPPPGTFVHDRDTDRAYQIPGGMDFLERIAARLSDAKQESSTRSRQPSLFTPSLWMYIITIGLGVTSGWLFVARASGHNQSQPDERATR